jgi:heme exporter protein D
VSTLGADAPNAPQFEDYSVVSKSAVKLHWKCLNDRADLSGFTIYTKRTDLDLFTNILPLPPQQSIFIVQNLEPGIKYTFHVSASNSFGESELSEPLTVNLVASPLGITLLLAEGNMLLVSAFMISLVSIIVAILVSVIYVKRFKTQQEEQLRRYSTLTASDVQKYHEKCGTTRSTATYATIPGIHGHVTIRSAGSNSSSGGYGCADPDEIRTARRISQKSMMMGGTLIKKPIEYEEAIYDDAPT